MCTSGRCLPTSGWGFPPHLGAAPSRHRAASPAHGSGRGQPLQGDVWVSPGWVWGGPAASPGPRRGRLCSAARHFGGAAARPGSPSSGSAAVVPALPPAGHGRCGAVPTPSPTDPHGNGPAGVAGTRWGAFCESHRGARPGGGVSCGVPAGSRSAESERRAAVSSVLLLLPSSRLCAPHRAPPRALPGPPQPSWVPPSPPELLGATVTPWCHRHPRPSCVLFGDLERGERRGCAGGAPMGTGGRSPPRPQGMEEGRERWPRRGHCSGPCPLPVLARGSAHPVDALGVPLRSPCGATRAPDVFLGLRSPRVSATLVRLQLLLWVFWGTETLSVPRGRCGCPLLASAREPRGGRAGRTG